MDHILIFITTLLCGTYLFLTTAFIIGLFCKAKHKNQNQPVISVIIPAKNEEKNIQACLLTLSQQTYPTGKTEIILVDDQSTDDTVKQAQACAVQNLKIISVTHQKHTCPKKNALDHGIAASTGEIIFTTDADCRPETQWLADTVKCFTPDMGMVIGYAPLIAPPKMWNPLLPFQSLVVAALSAGSVGVGFPLTCTGRNLAYRRKAYDEVGGFNEVGHIVGGDDVFLMRKIAQTPYRIAFNRSPLSHVPSQVHTDNQFNRQLRYQSKTLHYGPRVLLLALAVYIFHLILFLWPLWFWLTPTALPTLGGCLILKVGADALFLGIAAKLFSCCKHMIWFPLLEIVLFPYILIVSALGALKPSKWK